MWISLFKIGKHDYCKPDCNFRLLFSFSLSHTPNPSHLVKDIARDPFVTVTSVFFLCLCVCNQEVHSILRMGLIPLAGIDNPQTLQQLITGFKH